MSRTTHTDTNIRAALAALSVVGAITMVACQDGPFGPNLGRHPDATGKRPPDTAALIKFKPQLYFNGIVFVGTQDNAKGELYSMNPDGSGLFRITNDTTPDGFPDVSPLGPSIVWSRFSADYKTAEIFTQNLDGSKRKQLTSLGALTRYPRYSPDGTKIAFSSDVLGSFEIFVMNADGTGMIQLSNSGGTAQGPSWSPDGSKIAYQARDNAGFAAIWTMTASGGQQTLLVSCDANGGCVGPKWSSTGNEVAVQRGDGTGIFIVDATTGAQTGYIPSSAGDFDSWPTWSKDGQNIVFASKRSGNGTYDLYTMPPNRGSTAPPPPPVRLTSFAPGNEYAPAYSH
jgi:Tol biopolymer transport system component